MRAAGFDHADVAFDLIFKSFCKIAERIEVFYFNFGTKFFGAAQADADIGVAAE